MSLYSCICTNKNAILEEIVRAMTTSTSQNVGGCSVWTALRFKDRMVKVIMDVSALKDQKKGIVLQSTVS